MRFGVVAKLGSRELMGVDPIAMLPEFLEEIGVSLIDPTSIERMVNSIPYSTGPISHARLARDTKDSLQDCSDSHNHGFVAHLSGYG